MTQSDVPTAVICGCATGIGQAGARALAEAGWRLALLDNNPSVMTLAEEIGAEHVDVVDASDVDALSASSSAAIEKLGSLTAAWSNVGYQSGGGILTMTSDELEKAWAINVRSHMVVAREAVPALSAAGGGAMLLTSSNAGLFPEREMLAYSVTKAATVALAKCLAKDHAAEGIRVNALCPGYVDTPFNGPIWDRSGGRDAFVSDVGSTVPLGRMASAEEIGKMAAWLLSEDAGFVAGHAFVADGGELLA